MAEHIQIVDLVLINAALTRTGSAPISSLTEGKPAAQIASASYEQVVLAELARSRFKLPTKFEQLSLIDADEQGEPPAEWLYGYSLPTDLVKIRTLKVDHALKQGTEMGPVVDQRQLDQDLEYVEIGRKEARPSPAASC